MSVKLSAAPGGYFLLKQNKNGVILTVTSLVQWVTCFEKLQ